MDNKKIFNNDPSNFFFNQDKIISDEKKEEAYQYSLKLLNQDTCSICEEAYDLALRTPRIIVSCGHTFCTICLYLFYKDYRVKCPLCLKAVKRILSIEVLPINHIIHKKLLANIANINYDEKNLKLRLPKEINDELEKDEVELPLCETHEDRYKHFYIPKEKLLLCRACITENQVPEDYYQDLYGMPKENVEYILMTVMEGEDNSVKSVS